jgi:hypothetical protein
MKDLKKKLRASEDEVKKLEAENGNFLALLKDVQARISAAVGSTPAAKEDASEPPTVNGKPEAV